MDFKKILALLVALMMVVTVFAGCTEEKAEENDGEGEVTNTSEDASIDESQLPEDTSDNETVEPEETMEPVEPGLTINGEKIDTDGLIMMTVNGIEIPFDEYRYVYNTVDAYMFSGGDPAYWTQNADVFPTLLDATEYYVLENNWGRLLAKEQGVELTEEDEAEIDQHMEEEKASFESEEKFYEALDASGMTEDLLRRIISQQIMCNRAYKELYEKEGAPLAPSDDEIKSALTNDYRRVYHVLVANDHFADDEAYADATDEELKEAARKYAEELLSQIQNGADIYELAQEADDPGMIDNETGYFFSYGEMVEPFEKASFDLDVGELSGLVETDYGFHIIKRLEQDDYITENWDTVREDYINAVFNEYVNNMLENAEIEYSEYKDQLTYDSIS